MINLNKTIWKVILTAVVLTGGLSIGNTVCAQSAIDVEFENDPLFKNANIMPGDSVVRWMKVTNNSGETMPIAIEAINFPGFPNIGDVPSDDLSRALMVVIGLSGNNDLYGGTTGEKTLFELYQDGVTYLSDVANGATQ